MQQRHNYESTYILSPDLSVDDYTKLIEKFNRILTENGAEIINQEIWGHKKLAYPIKKKNTGYYCFTEFSGPMDLVHKIEREYQYDERILRYLTVSLDKDALAYNNKRRDKQSASKQPAFVPEESAS